MERSAPVVRIVRFLGWWCIGGLAVTLWNVGLLATCFSLDTCVGTTFGRIAARTWFWLGDTLYDQYYLLNGWPIPMADHFALIYSFEQLLFSLLLYAAALGFLLAVFVACRPRKEFDAIPPAT